MKHQRPTSPVLYDPAAAIEHCTWIANHQGPGNFVIKVLKDVRENKRAIIASGYFDNRGDCFEDEVRMFLNRNSSERVHIFYSVHAYSVSEAKAKFAVPGRLLHVDADGVKIPPNGPLPTRIVESSPGNYHFLYALNEPVQPKVAEELSLGLQRLVGGDVGGHSSAKLLRLVGTVNAKY
jgi:hypothetical protein